MDGRCIRSTCEVERRVPILSFVTRIFTNAKVYVKFYVENMTRDMIEITF